MTEKHAEGNADALSEESAELSAPTLDDFKVDLEPPKEKPKKAKKAEAEEAEDQVEEEAEESEEIEQSGDEEESDEGEVLSHELDIDQIPVEERSGYLDELYDSLDDEMRREWLSNREGRVGKDMGAMRKAKSEAEKRAEIAEAKAQELQAKTFPSDNPYASITDVEQLDAEAQKVDANIAAARKFLRGNEDYITVGDREVDRETVDQWLDTYLSQKEAIPKQKERIQSLKKAKERFQASEDKLESTYEWMKKQSGQPYEEYQKMVKDPKWSMIVDLVPELAEELPKVLAKYVSDGAAAPKKTLKIKGERKAKGDFGGAGTSRKKPSGSAQALERLRSGSATERDALAMFM